MDRLNLLRLELLCEVARRGSLSAAASARSYSTSSVSEQISLLEREVGMRLFERGARGVRLTEAGQVLAQRAEEIVARVGAARAELDDLAGLRSGRLRIGAFPTAGASLLPRALATFRGRHPGVDIDVIEADPEDAATLLAARELDVALTYQFDGRPPQAALPGESVHLFTDELQLMLPVDHPLAAQRSVGMKRLVAEPWVQGVRRGSTADVLPTACRAAGFEPRIAFETDDPMSVQGFVAAGLGVAVISQLIAPVARGDVVIRRLRPALRRQISVALAPRAEQPPAALALLDVLAELAPGPSRR